MKVTERRWKDEKTLSVDSRRHSSDLYLDERCTAAGHRPVAFAASVRLWSNRGNDRKWWLASRVSSYVNFYQFLRLSSSRLLNLNSHRHHHHHHPVISQVSSVQQWHLNLHKLTVKPTYIVQLFHFDSSLADCIFSVYYIVHRFFFEFLLL